MDVSKNRGGPPKWMVKIMENPIKMDDLVVPLFLATPICRLIQTSVRWHGAEPTSDGRETPRFHRSCRRVDSDKIHEPRVGCIRVAPGETRTSDPVMPKSIQKCGWKNMDL